MQLKKSDEEIVQNLFQEVGTFNQLEILQYYKKLINGQELPEQDKVEDVSVCFRIMCQIVDSFLSGYNDLQEQYKMLEQQLIKSEAENRNHIRIEQQLKMYAESLQEQLDLQENQLTVQKLHLTKLQKELVSFKKQMRQNSQERLITDSTQDRIHSIVSQQQKCQTIPIKLKKKRLTNENQKSSSVLGQYSTMERLQDAVNIYTKKKKTSQKQQRSNTIHVSEQSTRPKSNKIKQRVNTSCQHYDY